jgi:hypothetical protein
MTLIAFDWVMSLDPEWYSAIFGLLVGVSQALAATALAVLWLGLERWRVERRQPSGSGVTPRQSPDAGNLLLAILLLWGYLALMQLVTIWIANLPDEIRWLVPRLQTGWRWLGLAAVVLLPGLGLALLLSPRIKTHPRLLALAAGVVLAAQALYALWLTLPTLRPAGPRLTLLDLAVLLGAGALWLAAFGLYLALAGRAAPVRKGRLPATLPDVRNRHGVPAGSAPAAPPIPIGTAVRSAATAIAETGSHALAASGERVVAPAVAAGARAREQVPGGIAAGTVVKTMAGIAAVLIVSAVVLLPWRHQPGATAHPPAVGPALLANPVANLAVYRRSQQEQVGAWGWVSRKDGIARIPVDRAIQILLARKPPPASTQEARP